MSTTPKAKAITDIPTIIHHGYNIRDYRKMRKLSQAELGKAMGKGWDQRKVSDLEKQESIEENILAKVADALKISVDELKDNREATIYNIQNNHEGSNVTASYFTPQHCTFNPLDEYKKVVDENKKLYEELLKSEREKIALLEKMMKEKK